MMLLIGLFAGVFALYSLRRADARAPAR